MSRTLCRRPYRTVNGRAGFAGRSLTGAPTALVSVAADYGEHFNDARRILNSVTDRYLFPLREQWFGH